MNISTSLKLVSGRRPAAFALAAQSQVDQAIAQAKSTTSGSSAKNGAK